MSILPLQTNLPIEEILPDLLSALNESNSVVLQAPPGAGKTTMVPLCLLGLNDLDGKKILMLEPRRLAARAAARRMADLLGENVGETVGYRIRLDTKVGPKTQIEVVTEGILTRRLQEDPELRGVGVVIFDEFHERSLQTDLGLALTRQCQEILRDDLKIVIMSATLNTERVADLLEKAPIIKSEGRQFPVETRFSEKPVKGRIEGPLANWISEIAESELGDILVFLPGAGEISRTISALSAYAKKKGISLLPLFGNLSQKDQDKALFPNTEGQRKIVFATDIAETSLTIEGIRIVVDAGLARSPRFDPNSGMSRLETRRVSRASADQRRGRAGRLGPGLCYRFWTLAEDRGLIPHSDPEIASADLSSMALELAKWGVKDVSELAWMTEPPAGLLGQATDLLQNLGAIDTERNITPLGLKMVRLPLHPRLARMIVMADGIGGGGLACDIAALLSDRDILKTDRDAPNSDIRSRLEILNRSRSGDNTRPELKRLIRSADDLRRRFNAGKKASSLANVGTILAFAYPDRIGELRAGSKTNYRLSGGRGAILMNNDKLQSEPYLVVADLDGKGRDARIYLAAPISYKELIEQFNADVEISERVYWDAEKERVIALEETKIGALVLDSKRLKNPSPDSVSRALLGVVRAKSMRNLPWSEGAASIIQRVEFTRYHDQKASDWPDFSEDWLLANLEEWLLPFMAGKNSLSDLQSLKLEEILVSMLSWEQQQHLKQYAPARFAAPTGSAIRIDYSNKDSPVLAVRLQEMFGQADVPPLASGKVPVSIHLLSPARRPAQITQDLAGFWKNSYAAVKKDLKGQYPRHFWPDDPMEAEPTARPKPRKR